ncbi:MAG: hypothetical protein V7607_1801 [Solirubrobacteraceae bacterium]
MLAAAAALALQIGALPLAAAEAAPGDLTFAACLGGLIGCPGINPSGVTDGAAGVALSPDGRSLYLGAHFGSAVTHFTFDAAGNPSFESCIGNHSGCTVPGAASGALNGARGVAVSSDGKQLYAAAYGGNAISHFTLDASGKPAFVGCVGNHAGCTAISATAALNGVSRVSLSADGKHLYAAAPYNTTPAGRALSWFTLDAAGAPTFVGCFGAVTGCTAPAAYPPAVDGASDIALSADGRNMYVASTTGALFSDSNTVSHFTLDAAGTPTFERCIGNHPGCTIPTPADAVFAASSIAVSADGARLYVGANADLAYFTLDAAGVPTFASCIGGLSGCTATTPAGLLFGAFGIKLGADGKQLYVASYGTDAIAHFSLGSSGAPTLVSCVGDLTGCAPTSPAGAVDGPFDFAVTRDGRRLYAAIYNGGLVDRFDIEQPPVAPAGPATPGQVVDVTAPTLKDYTLSRATFAAVSKGASIAVAAAAKAKVGTSIRYALSEAATMAFRVERASGGRKVKGKCVKPSSTNRRGKRCRRYVALKGTVSHASGIGRNSLKFSGRWRGRKLAPARYALVATARDAAGNVSKPQRVSFKIVAR